MTSTEQLRLLPSTQGPASTPADIAMAFDLTRLTQARHLPGLTKTALAQQIRISAAGVGQWTAGTTPPRLDHLQGAAEVLDIPIDFLASDDHMPK